MEERLKEYYKITPKDQIDKGWDKARIDDSVNSPTVEESFYCTLGKDVQRYLIKKGETQCAICGKMLKAD